MNYKDNLDQAQKVVKQIAGLLETELKNGDDFALLLAVLMCEEEESIIDKLTFNAKYISGLFRVLAESTQKQDVANSETVATDLIEAISRFTADLLEGIRKFAPDLEEYFHKNYTLDTKEAKENLNYLIYGFELLKLYLNFINRS